MSPDEELGMFTVEPDAGDVYVIFEVQNAPCDWNTPIVVVLPVTVMALPTCTEREIGRAHV